MSQNKNELDVIAEKFVSIPKDITSKQKVIDGGFMTEEEYDKIKLLPRSAEMESGTKWGKIKYGDKERSLYPFSGALTETEHQIYNSYKAGLRSGTGTTSVKAEDRNKELDELKAELISLKVPAEILSKLEKFRVVKKNSLISDMFGVDTIQALTGKVNLAYIMYRGPNGEFSESLQPDPVDLVKKGFMPKYTLEQVKSNVEKLATKGIIVKNTIVDLA